MDGKCRLCAADGSLLTKTFGSGLAYPTRTNDGMMRPDGGRPNPRADSFSLYTGWVANRVLQNLLPKTVLDNKLHRTMRNNRKKAADKQQQNQSPQKKSVSVSRAPVVRPKPTPIKTPVKADKMKTAEKVHLIKD